ncbi:MAG: hypothetical protein HC789_20970 [Microcoleus sp. CSU_2_2]|nr:hypothetical protein [Microcoleus sp. CSU_2_2]
MRRYEQLSLLLGDLIATHHTIYNGDESAGFGISPVLIISTFETTLQFRQ